MSNPTELPIDLIHDFRDAINIAHQRADHAGDSVRKRRWQDVSKRLEIYAAARRAQPEGEAPQYAELTEHLRQFQHNDASGLVFGYDKKGIDRMMARLLASRPAATLSPLCGAQPEESRDDVLEEAAQACVAWGNAKVMKWAGDPEMLEDAKARAWDGLQCAAAIRELKQRAAQLDGGQEGRELCE